MPLTIPQQFDGLAVDDSLKREENPLSNGGKWAVTWFANNIGKATSTGFVTQEASKWAGAAWTNESLKELPALVKVTLAVEPATNGQQLYLGLYGRTNAEGSENGVFFEVFRQGAEKYFIELFYREAGVAHSLGTASEVSIKTGDMLGLSYDGTNLTAWRKRGSEWTELLSRTGVPSLSVFNNYSQIAASGNSADTTYRLTEFATGPLAVAESTAANPLLAAQELPRAARYAVELTFKDGSDPALIGPDEADPEDVAVSASFETELPGGFGPGKFQAARPPDLEETPARLFAMVRCYDAGTGQTYYRGRVTAVGWSEATVDIESEGMAKHLEDDQTASEVFYDRDLGRWGAPTAARVVATSSTYVDSGPQVESDFSAPALATTVTGGWAAAPALPLCEGWYDAGSGNAIALVDYAWKKSGQVNAADANWVWAVGLSADDTGTISSNFTSNLRAAGPGSGTLPASGTTPRRFAVVWLQYLAGPAGAAGQAYQVLWPLLGVAGTHGLPLQGSVSTPNVGRGVLGSDVARYVVETWAPLLEASAGPGGSIEGTTFPIPHLVFYDPTTARAMIEAVAVLGGSTSAPMDWGVYDEFFMRQPGTYGRTWRVRLDQGTTQSNSGPDASERLNGVLVTYDDGTGRVLSVGPPGSGADSTSAVLEDTDPTNPANQDGARHWRTFDAGITSVVGATAIGQLLLARANSIVWRGSVQVAGRALEDGGGWHPVADVRAGDYVIVEDDVDRRPRRIVNTSLDDQSVTAACGTPPDRLDVLLAREAVGLFAPQAVVQGAHSSASGRNAWHGHGRDRG